jgi:hypothetical protein
MLIRKPEFLKDFTDLSGKVKAVPSTGKES